MVQVLESKNNLVIDGFAIPDHPEPLPKILVLLAAHNGADWISAQIDSILGQVGVEVRVVIRDDGSSDATADIIAKISKDDARVELIEAGDATGSAAKNFFRLVLTCDGSSYDFIALSDQDDVWHSGKLSRAVDLLRRTQASGYSGAVTAVWPGGRARVLRQETAMTQSDYLFEGAGQGCTYVVTGPLYRRIRDFLASNGELTATIHYHDWTIYALARAWGLSWVFNQQPTMDYRQHSGNDTGARSSFQGVLKRFGKIRSGWYLQQLLGVSDICYAVAKSSPVVATWHSLLRSPRTWRRRLAIAGFCLRGGRRRIADNGILVLSALVGWI